MYWLSTNRWCLGPYACSSSVLICLFLAFTPFLLPLCLLDSTVHSGWYLSLAAWRTYGLLGSCSLSFISSLDWALLGQESSSSFRAHIFLPCVHRPLGYCFPISFHRAYHSFTLLSVHVTSWACGLLCQPTSLSIFCSRLSKPTFHIFTSLGFHWPTFLLHQPISSFYFSSFLGPFTTSLPLLLSWVFC